MSETNDATDGGGSSNANGIENGGIAVGRAGRLVIWITLALAVTGLAFGLVPMFYGSFGEQQYETPGDSDEDLSDREQAREDAIFKNQAINLVSTLGPFLAITMAAGAGFVAGARGGGEPTELAIGTAAGAFLGTVLFVFLSTVVAMEQWWVVEGGFLEPRWLQWDQTIINGVLNAVPAAIAAPMASIAGVRLAA